MMFLKAVSAGRRTYPVITDGLKLYLDAYNIRSYPGTGTTWYDLSNSAYNLTNNGGTWTVSGGRRYFELDGVNDRINGDSNTTLFDNNTVGWTWSIWVLHVTSPQFLDVIINTEYNSDKLSYYLDNRASQSSGGQGWRTGSYMGGPPVQDMGTTYVQTVTTNVWRHVCAVWSYTTSTTGTIRLYINGSQVTSANTTVTSGYTWSSFNTSRYPVIGAFGSTAGFSRFNNIRVGEVLNYNRNLSATEVSNNYNSTKSNYGL